MTAALVAIAVAAVAAASALVHRRRKPAERPLRIDPFVLSEPWRRYVSAAQSSQRKYAEIVTATRAGPLRSNMESITRQVQRGVEECWLIARRGDELDDALNRLDSTALAARLEAATDDATRTSLKAQLDSAQTDPDDPRRHRPTTAPAQHPPRRAARPGRRGQCWRRLDRRSGQRSRRRRDAAANRCGSPSKTSTTRAPEALVRRPHPREQPAAIERHGSRRHGGLACHRAGESGRHRHRSQPGPGQPMHTTRPTAPRT